MTIVAGIDIGGTYTDLVLRDESTGAVRVAKVLSTPADLSQGLIDGLRAFGIELGQIGLIVHGTTVATNAVLERTGARCGLIMTEGFRDVLELRRRERPHTYGLKGSFTPLVSRDCRLEVAERTDYKGRVEREPAEADVIGAAEALLAKDVEVVIVSFINAYANSSNELIARDALRKVWPNAYIVAASQVLPEIREFERTSTAVLNGYVQPLIDRYLANVMKTLAQNGYARDVLLVQSNGGVMSQAVAREHSVNTILSGPAAGVEAARQIGQAANAPNLIACDIGGTSLDIAVVTDGRAATAREVNLEYGIPIRLPMLDIRSVGAGGGSIAWIDRAGVLNIGPQSAGADPGPVCYGKGGSVPTVTDANLVLGRINPNHPIGGDTDWRLDKAAAEATILHRVGQPLGVDTVQAAWAIVQVANHKISAAIRTLTVEQGLDPRDYALVLYGGAGPLHAGPLLQELEIARAIVPPWPGITSALGCLVADVRHDYIESVNERLERLDPAALYETLQGHLAQGRRLIEQEGVQVVRVEASYHADMAYEGQVHEVRTPLPPEPCGREAIQAAFEAAYRSHFGDTVGDHPVRIVTLRTAVAGVRPTLHLRPDIPAAGGPIDAALRERRPVYFEGGFRQCPVYDRLLLPMGALIEGPAVIEQDDATTVIEPGLRGQVDEQGNLILTEG